MKTYYVNCTACQTVKQHKTVNVPFQKVEKDHYIGNVLHIDICGALSMTFRKKKFILIITDSTARFLEAVALKKSHTVLNLLNKYFGMYELVKEIILVNTKYFRSIIFQEYMKTLGIEIYFSSSYRHKANS